MRKSKKIQILVIEDNLDHLFFIKKALDAKNYVLKIIRDGEKAYQYLLKPDIQPDVVLLDHYLPNIKGFEILEKLGPKKALFRFIFMSVDNDRDTRKKAIDLGCLDYIVKGADMGTLLLNAIKKTVKKLF